MHASGVHATVAGVLLAFTVPVVRSQAAGGPDAGPGLAEHFEHRFRPLSAGVAVPVFAFFSAGVTVGGLSGLGTALTDSVAVGRGRPGRRQDHWHHRSHLAGLPVHPRRTGPRPGGPTSSGCPCSAGSASRRLLIGELAFGAGTPRDEHVKVGVLTGTLLAAMLAAGLLRARDRRYRRIAEADTRDDDADGIRMFQHPDDHVPAKTLEERSERRQPHGDPPLA